LPKSSVHRVGERVAIVEHDFAQRFQMRRACLPRRIRRTQISVALIAQQRFERDDLW
jgi:hypothetical protein